MSTSKPQDLPDMHLKDLHVGDVLLSRGQCPPDHRGICLSDLIAKLDGGDYSHVAFFDGEHFVQATTHNVQASKPVILPAVQKYMHVYRFHSNDGKPLGDSGLPTEKLVEYARSTINTPYGYSQLVLVGILVLLRRYPGPETIKDILEVLGGIALYKLKQYIESLIGDRAKTLVCSELLSEIFWQPSNSDGQPYGLPIEITKRHRIKVDVPTQEQLDEYQHLVTELETVFEQATPNTMAQIRQHREAIDPNLLGHEESVILIGGSAKLPSMCVSPCDLQRSPALRLIGNYVDT